MKEFLRKVFGSNKGAITIDCFSIWHFLYLILITGSIIGAGFALRKKSNDIKQKTLNIMAIVTLVLYLVDFFLQPFVGSSFELNIDKLPFHICTLMSIMAVFAQYSQKGWFKELVVALSITGPLMYLVYPGSALGGITPWCYKVIQTMLYHGMLLAWGILSLTTGQVKLHLRKVWLPLVGILCVAAWATIGNICYNSHYAGGGEHYDWFFLTGSTFDMSPWLMPFLTIAAVYAVTVIVYLISWLCELVANKRAKVG